jgi:DNA-binding transcriptional MocR family regulator
MDSKTSGPPRADAQQTDFYVVIPWPVYQLGAYASHVYGALRKRADEQMRCWPSHRRIAADSGLSVRTVQACLATLREEGWIDWEQRKSGDGKNPNTSNIYRVYGSARARRGASGAAPQRK